MSEKPYNGLLAAYSTAELTDEEKLQASFLITLNRGSGGVSGESVINAEARRDIAWAQHEGVQLPSLVHGQPHTPVCPSCYRIEPGTPLPTAGGFSVPCNDSWHEHVGAQMKGIIDEVRNRADIERLHRFLAENDGQLVVSHRRGEWTVGVTWGKDDPEGPEDQELAGAASYAVGKNLAECFRQILVEARVEPKEQG